MKKYLLGPIKQELGQEIIVTRPRILAAIARLKEEDPDCSITVLSFSGRGALYTCADYFIGFGSYQKMWRAPLSNQVLAGICKISEYEKIDASSEPFSSASFKLPDIKKEWEEKAQKIATGDFITISARFRRDEGARNFLAWNEIIEGLKDFPIICTSPKGGSPDLPIPFLSDFIGEEDKDAMGIEMALHNKAKISITSNTGSAGIMLLSNPKNVLIFGGTGGYLDGWTGLRKHLSENNEAYRTRLIDPPKTSYHSISQKKEQQIGIANLVCERALKEISK